MSANEYVVIDGVRYAAIALAGAIGPDGKPAGKVVMSDRPQPNEEIIEILNAEAVGATVTSNVWISTRDMVDGLLHWATSAAQTGNITAYYSFDGITSVNQETIQALAGGAAESHALGFNDFDAGADVAGFTLNVKRYPYVRFGLLSGAGTGTISAMARVIRRG